VTIDAIMRTARVIPVLVVEDPSNARPIAQALVEGGLPVLEVTLRTAAALEVISEMAAVPGAIVGAGTVLNASQLDAACAAGAGFIVSPGLTDPLARAAIERGTPYLPGIANAGDIMRGLDLGLDRFKFFPAEASGGRKALAALAGPFGAARFCPTGGVTAESAPGWLSEPYVLCVGGTWLVAKGAPDLDAIRSAAQSAAALR
jgi:2-dehydro-3-deoxyphosphogluconate aldolase/(4S)-4-hydroxy-2-oxoglutarate aldolase